MLQHLKQNKTKHWPVIYWILFDPLWKAHYSCRHSMRLLVGGGLWMLLPTWSTYLLDLCVGPTGEGGFGPISALSGCQGNILPNWQITHNRPIDASTNITSAIEQNNSPKAQQPPFSHNLPFTPLLAYLPIGPFLSGDPIKNSPSFSSHGADIWRFQETILVGWGHW